MKKREIFSYGFFRPVMSGLLFYLFIVFCIPCVNVSARQDENIPQYNPPIESGEVLRREGGNIGVSRGFNRDLLRSLTRDLTRGFTRSLMRGEDRRLFRSLMRGEERSLFRSLMRGEDRSLTRAQERSLFRSLMRGEDRSLFRSLMRGEDRSLFRSLMRGEDRSLFRGLTRAEERSLFRSLMRGEDRSLFRSLMGGEDLSLFSGDLDKPEVFQDMPIPGIMAPLACLRTGYTIVSQPVLRWYISGPWKGKIEFTLNQADTPEPVLQIQIDGPAAEGIYGIKLAEYGITLQPNTEYEWFVTIVPYPRERSADFLGSAVISYVPPSEAFENLLTQTPDYKRCHLFAGKGYWYDAIDQLCRQIKKNPEDHTLLQYRVELLEQVKLGTVTDYDRKQLQ